MKKFFQLAWIDIKNRQNIELYLTLIVAVIVFIANIIGVKNQDILFNVVLGVLAVMLFKSIQDSHATERFERKIDDLLRGNKSVFLRRWDNNVFKECLVKAKVICGVWSQGNYEFLHTNFSMLREFMAKGGKIKFVYVDPESNAFELATHRYFSEQDNKEKNKNAQLRFQLTLQTLKELAQVAPTPESIQIKFTCEIPSSTITLINHQTNTGMIFVTLHDYFSSSIGPSFILDKSEEQWFNAYASVFENLWSKLSEQNIIQ
jgi:hypothetical protein